MQYIVSRSFGLPDTAEEMAARRWYSAWARKYWPYGQVVSGDTIFWYEPPAKRIVWRSTAHSASRFAYRSKAELAERLGLDVAAKTERYFVDAPDAGFCVGWHVHECRAMDTPKPDWVRFPQLGWMKADVPEAALWLGTSPCADDLALDDIVAQAPLVQQLAELDCVMAGLSPERIRQMMAATNRKDGRLIRALKKAAGYRCQYPGCTALIETRDGTPYVEVAHVHPVSRGGESRLGNLVVLCPNHHKEFDLGCLRVDTQERGVLRGTLNGRGFEIRFPW